MNKFKKVFIVAFIIAVSISCLTGCQRETTSSRENEYTQNLMKQASDSIGYPEITNFFERAQLKEIYELRDNPNLVCYWYTKNDMSGKWIYQGTCVGYGIPYGTSITQTDTVQRAALPALSLTGEDKGHNDYYTEILPQAEPNGLYTNGLSTSATWILTTDADGNIAPTYVESEITVTQVKVDARLCEDWSLPNNY